MLATLPPVSTVYATEGTNAHYLGELCIKQNSNPNAMIGIKINNPETGEFVVTPKMAYGVSYYLNAIKEAHNNIPGGTLLVETWMPIPVVDGDLYGGTIDCVIVKPFEIVHIIDYKNGITPVDHAEHNTQLYCYAYAAATFYRAQTIRVSIIQPNEMNGRKETHHEFTFQELKQKALELEQKAYVALGNSATFNAGDWCRSGFCDYRPHCPAYANMDEQMGFALAVQDDARKVPDVQEITASDQRCLAILEVAKQAEDLIKQVKQHALERELSGNPIPGTKAIEGKKSKSWINTDAHAMAEAIFTACLIEDETKAPIADEFFEPGKLKSVTKIDELLLTKGYKKKQRQAILKGLFRQNNGKVHSVHFSDKRKEYDYRQKVDAKALFAEFMKEKEH